MANKKLIHIAQFCLHHQIQESLIFSLNEYGLVEIVSTAKDKYLHIHDLSKVEKLIRLHLELEINLEGIDAVYTLLEQIRLLQQELLAAKNRLLIFAPTTLDDDNNHLDH